jgi:L-alanine-DL-glutamate epimerase-like enolase superfamily enzyme
VAEDDVYIEAPCTMYEESLAVREHTRLPFILDEVITGVTPFLRALRDRAMDVINIKISRVGGLTEAIQFRNLCASEGRDCQDTGGQRVGRHHDRDNHAHLVGSAWPEFHFTSTDFNSYIDVALADDAPRREAGRLAFPTGPGLGIHVNENALGKPVVTVT